MSQALEGLILKLGNQEVSLKLLSFYQNKHWHQFGTEVKTLKDHSSHLLT